MEGDFCQYASGFTLCHFNPLPPHGGRRLDSITHRPSPVFQSTPSAWRETFIFFFLPVLFFYFNPLPPHGGRLPGACAFLPSISFQSTPSAWRETVFFCNPLCNCIIFQSTPSAWRETHFPKIIHANITDFNPLPPHGGRRC